MTDETTITLAMVAVPVVITGVWLAADIAAERKERRHARETFDRHIADLARGRAALATRDGGHGRA